MPTQFQRNCPHCSTAKAGFVVRHQWPQRSASNRAYVVARCGVCGNGIIADMWSPGHSTFPDMVGGEAAIDGSNIQFLQTWPSYESSIPSAVPENVASFFEQGMRALKASHWDAAGAMFRKTLDVATKLLEPEHRDKTLFKRIELLVESGKLTPAMSDWSHEIRLDGNEAVHGEEPESEQDALVLQKFAEAFLTYSFSLPALVEANRAKRQPANDSASGAAA